MLIDPILTPGWGFTPAMGLQVWPPRAVDLGAMPPIDAVLLSHEHEGHFEIPSLLRLDRRVPIYLSDRASRAMPAFLRGLGFAVHPIRNDAELRIGSLLLHTLCPSHRRAISDEWEVLPLLVRDEANHGSFFTTIDAGLTDAMWQRCREILPAPGLFAVTTNANDFSFVADHLPARDDTAEITAFHMARLIRRLRREWGEAAAWLLVGQGFSFGDAQSFLNGAAFPFCVEAMSKIISDLHPEAPMRWLSPGTTAVMQGGALAEIHRRAPFVQPLPRTAWPGRGTGNPTWLESYTPATGQTTLGPGELEALQAELDLFATYLHVRRFSRAGNMIPREIRQGRSPTLAIVARDGDGAYVWAYEPQACRFTAVEVEDPAATYAIVFECWATDLLASLRCEVSANTLLFGRS